MLVESNVILVDTGPLVALVDGDDQYHAVSTAAYKQIQHPLGTVWPAVVEAMYLLGFSWEAQDAVWELIETEALKLLPLGSADAPRMRQLMRKYRDLPMDLADAALVRVAEREKIATIFTLDRRDFHLYRLEGLRRFTILP